MIRHRSRSFLAAVLVTLAPLAASAEPLTTTLAQQAFSKDAAISARAVAALRTYGQPAVNLLLRENSKAEQLDPDGKARRLAAIDKVCAQLDCNWSGLFWYTDLGAARREATRTHRPILSLRLLGRLDEDLSCANSRFFRTTLYSNRDINEYLRRTFVLHWSSERPAPKVTIDFGDGRKMVRTLTGNSIHYLLAPDGTPLDALPGLYSPNAFLAALVRMANFGFGVMEQQPEARGKLVTEHHGKQSELARQVAQSDKAHSSSAKVSYLLPTAWEAAPMATSKMAVEQVMLEQISFGRDAKVGEAPSIEGIGSHSELAGYDAASLSLMKLKHSGGRPLSNAEFAQVLRSLERTVAEDTIRNEFVLRQEVRAIFLRHKGNVPFDELNREIYSKVFLTPATDPWLGLLPGDVFTGIDGEGIQGGNLQSLRR